MVPPDCGDEERIARPQLRHLRIGQGLGEVGIALKMGRIGMDHRIGRPGQRIVEWPQIEVL